MPKFEQGTFLVALVAAAASFTACSTAAAPVKSGGVQSPISFSCGGRRVTLGPGSESVSFNCGGTQITVDADGAPGVSATSARAETDPILSLPAKETAAIVPTSAAVPRTIVMADSQAAEAATGAGAHGAGAAGTSTGGGDTAGAGDAGNKPPATALSAKDFYVGAGFAMSQNIGSERADSVTFVTRSDGRVLAQVQQSKDRNIGVMLETHYLLQNQGLFRASKAIRDKDGQVLRDKDGNVIYDGTVVDRIASFFACGPFSFISEDVNRLGCGPLFTAIMDNDGKVTQFGIGWALGLGATKDGQADSRAGFGVGIGLLFDTGAKTLDSRIVEPSTMLVRPEFQSLVASNGVSALVTRPTTSAFVMVSKTFN